MNNVDAIREGLDKLKNEESKVEVVNLLGTFEAWPEGQKVNAG